MLTWVLHSAGLPLLGFLTWLLLPGGLRVGVEGKKILLAPKTFFQQYWDPSKQQEWKAFQKNVPRAEEYAKNLQAKSRASSAAFVLQNVFNFFLSWTRKYHILWFSKQAPRKRQRGNFIKGLQKVHRKKKLGQQHIKILLANALFLCNFMWVGRCVGTPVQIKGLLGRLRLRSLQLLALRQQKFEVLVVKSKSILCSWKRKIKTSALFS